MNSIRLLEREVERKMVEGGHVEGEEMEERKMEEVGHVEEEQT